VLSIAVLALATPLAAADLPELRSRGTLRVLVSADEEPLFFNLGGSGEPGFERELLQGFASLQGLKVEPVPVSRFETIVSDLVGGKGDVITGIIDNEGRRKQIDFTSEVLPARHVAVTCKPAPVLEAVERTRRFARRWTSTWATPAGVPPGAGWS
jgi:ABC-type amino acid transport substrate-binding protein